MSARTIIIRGMIAVTGLSAVCLTADAASKTVDTTTAPKSVSALPTPKPAPVPERPIFVPVPSKPAAPRPTFPDRPVSVPAGRSPLPGEQLPRRIFPDKTPPITTLPGPATLPAWKREPAEQSFVETALVSFAKGETHSVSLFFSADGHRLQIDSYTVGWHLPKGQTGVIDFAPTSSTGTRLPPGSLGLYADPGEPLKIYGSRTGADGSGMAMITFFGTKTPVPREQESPTDL